MKKYLIVLFASTSISSISAFQISKITNNSGNDAYLLVYIETKEIGGKRGKPAPGPEAITRSMIVEREPLYQADQAYIITRKGLSRKSGNAGPIDVKIQETKPLILLVTAQGETSVEPQDSKEIIIDEKGKVTINY